tara:strand:- start:8760 stop:9212 length:453 start_codon:yes stop_codon:yes gene_type:complete
MAKILFTKNSVNQIGAVGHIAQDQNFLDSNKNFDEANFDILDITTEEFNDVKNGVKFVLSHNGETVSFNTRDTSEDFFDTENDLKTYINDLLERFETYLQFNSSKPLANTVTVYSDWLKNLDTSSVSLNSSLEKYASDQGVNPVHPLELL